MKTIINLTNNVYVDKLFDLAFTMNQQLTCEIDYKSVNDYAKTSIFVDYLDLNMMAPNIGYIGSEATLISSNLERENITEEKFVFLLFKTGMNKKVKLDYVKLEEYTVQQLIDILIGEDNFDFFLNNSIFSKYMTGLENKQGKYYVALNLLPTRTLKDITNENVDMYIGKTLDNIGAQVSNRRTIEEIKTLFNEVADMGKVYDNVLFKLDGYVISNYTLRVVHLDNEEILNQDNSNPAIAVYLPHTGTDEKNRDKYIEAVNKYLMVNKNSSVYVIVHKHCDISSMPMLGLRGRQHSEVSDLSLDVIFKHHQKAIMVCPNLMQFTIPENLLLKM